jgi:hypothetical protein
LLRNPKQIALQIDACTRSIKSMLTIDPSSSESAGFARSLHCGLAGAQRAMARYRLAGARRQPTVNAASAKA